MELLPNINFQFDMIFADPPYFLSNGGISVQSGKQVSVNKGEWDKSHGFEEDTEFNRRWLVHQISVMDEFEEDTEFNRRWLTVCREKLKRDGTIWISGTFHNIFSVAQMLNELNFRILNCITWAKTNPPPNLSCKFFTHSTEFIIWARREKKVPHYYNYELMREINGGTQMRDVWSLPAISRWEKSCGKHPTQKPLPLLARIILASTRAGEWILDPFAGSSTTGIAASLLNRRFLGLEKEFEFLELSKNRRIEIDDPKKGAEYRNKILKYSDKPLQLVSELHEDEPSYGCDLPVE